MSLSLITEPIGYPIRLEDVRRQTKSEGVSADDVLIQDVIIPAVVDRAEQATARQMLKATWQLTQDGFGCWIDVPRPPLIAGSLTVSYLDAAGVSQMVDPALYVVEAPVGPRAPRGRIRLAYGASWPLLTDQPGAVSIQFDAGYGTEWQDVPALLRMAMLLDAGTLYRHREQVLVGGDASAIELPTGADSIYRKFLSRPRQ